MRIFKFTFVMFLSAFLISGCFSEGPKIYIETDTPMDDFIVECAWGSVFTNIMSGKRTVTQRKYRVIRSGVDFECGSALGKGAYAEVSHPLYGLYGVCTHKKCGARQTESGSFIVKPVKQLKRLDQCELKYKEGFWNNNNSPESDFARCMGRVCGFPDVKTYIKYEKKKNAEYFENLYGSEILLCYERTIPVLKKYLPGSYKNHLDAKTYVENVWERLR